MVFLIHTIKRHIKRNLFWKKHINGIERLFSDVEAVMGREKIQSYQYTQMEWATWLLA